MRIALIGGRRVAYDIGGDPTGQPVFVIHGAWGGPASTLWNGPRIRWSAPTDGLKLIWYDRRCAGLSQYDAEPFTLSDLANDAVGVLDYLDLNQAAVIATSAGGPIGLRLALDHPQRVESLVLLNTGASLMSLSQPGVDPADPFVADRLETVAMRLALLDLFHTQGVEAAVAASENEWRLTQHPPDPDPVLNRIRNNRQRALRILPKRALERLAHGALLNMNAQRDVDLSGEIGRIECPVLILHGDADTTVPIAFGRALSESIPNATFNTLPDAEHGLVVNANAQRIAAVWLRRVSSGHGEHRSSR